MRKQHTFCLFFFLFLCERWRVLEQVENGKIPTIVQLFSLAFFFVVLVLFFSFFLFMSRFVWMRKTIDFLYTAV